MGGKANPFAGVGEMLKGSQPDAGASAGSSGSLKAQIDAVKKVLETVIQSAGPGKTFFSRAAQLLDQGLSAESSQGPGTSPSPKPEGASASPEGMSRPPSPAFAG
jgi:hypothetical protein